MQLLPTMAGIAIGAGIALAVPVNAVAENAPRAEAQPPSGTQVQLTRLDAAAPEPGTLDFALLVGVGAAGIAGGAALFAAARHAARDPQ